jgi:hypothetical protein
MNDEAARQGRNATNSAEPNGSTVPHRIESPLAEATRALKDARLDAIDTLDERQWRAFISTALDVFGADGARLAVADFARELADDQADAA